MVSGDTPKDTHEVKLITSCSTSVSTARGSRTTSRPRVRRIRSSRRCTSRCSRADVYGLRMNRRMMSRWAAPSAPPRSWAAAYRHVQPMMGDEHGDVGRRRWRCRARWRGWGWGTDTAQAQSDQQFRQTMSKRSTRQRWHVDPEQAGDGGGEEIVWAYGSIGPWVITRAFASHGLIHPWTNLPPHRRLGAARDVSTDDPR
jgi:hypothetical protein